MNNKITSLDNDFITIWSGHSRDNDYDKIQNPLTKLAELGQINAVQAHYLYNGDENPTIRNHVENISDKPVAQRNGDEWFALSNFQFASHDKQQIAKEVGIQRIDGIKEGDEVA